MLKYYKLVGRKVVEVQTLDEAVEAFADKQSRRIARTSVGEIDISTVFLMFDHRLYGEGPPVIFETMCFAPEESDVGPWMRRYCTFQEALTGHNQVVDEVREVMSTSKEIAQQSLVVKKPEDAQ